VSSSRAPWGQLAAAATLEHALARLALTVTLTPKAITPEDVDALRRPGLSDADTLEAIETSSSFNHETAFSSRSA
jgi:hypothetical protein